MALKGKPRDMNKWREVLLDPNVHFPGELSEYRPARNELLEAEAELRRLNEQVAAQRRALPARGLIWRNLRLLSSRNNTFNRDYHAEAPDGGQLPVLNVFSRDEDGIHHHWASEMTFKRGDTSSLDPVWAIYGVLDLTREGRGDSAAYPNLQY